MAIVDVRRACIALLARREYSRQELQQRLERKEFDADEITAVLDEFSSKDLQSDERFCESYGRMRLKSGLGPVRIRYELQQRGVAGKLIEAFLDEQQSAFRKSIKTVWHKKYAGKKGSDPQTIAKQLRFLHYRGFTADMIRELFGST